jgi:hypothetical protein
VVLNIAPLHEIVPWKEARSYWDELLKGEYEWSSIGKRFRHPEPTGGATDQPSRKRRTKARTIGGASRPRDSWVTCDRKPSMNSVHWPS